MSVQRLKDRLAHFHSLHKITTIDAAQGTEDDYVIVSLVRSNQNSALGFVGDPKRANVAITHSKYGTILIGDADCCFRGSESVLL